jgi:hypothetical protein
VDLDIEIRPRNAEDVLAQQLLLRRRWASTAFSVIEQVAVFAAQIDKALGRADRIGSHRHALKDQIGEAGQQHAVLEGARFAFVGIADDDALVPGLEVGVAAGFPFQRRW